MAQFFESVPRHVLLETADVLFADTPYQEYNTQPRDASRISGWMPHGVLPIHSGELAPEVVAAIAEEELRAMEEESARVRPIFDAEHAWRMRSLWNIAKDFYNKVPKPPTTTYEPVQQISTVPIEERTIRTNRLHMFSTMLMNITVTERRVGGPLTIRGTSFEIDPEATRTIELSYREWSEDQRVNWSGQYASYPYSESVQMCKKIFKVGGSGVEVVPLTNFITDEEQDSAMIMWDVMQRIIATK